jgi:hypothetical protein
MVVAAQAPNTERVPRMLRNAPRLRRGALLIRVPLMPLCAKTLCALVYALSSDNVFQLQRTDRNRKSFELAGLLAPV